MTELMSPALSSRASSAAAPTGGLGVGGRGSAVPPVVPVQDVRKRLMASAAAARLRIGSPLGCCGSTNHAVIQRDCDVGTSGMAPVGIDVCEPAGIAS